MGFLATKLVKFAATPVTNLLADISTGHRQSGLLYMPGNHVPTELQLKKILMIILLSKEIELCDWNHCQVCQLHVVD